MMLTYNLNNRFAFYLAAFRVCIWLLNLLNKAEKEEDFETLKNKTLGHVKIQSLQKVSNLLVLIIVLQILIIVLRILIIVFPAKQG